MVQPSVRLRELQMGFLDIVRRMTVSPGRSLVDIAAHIGGPSDKTTKPSYIWEAYESYLAPLASLPIKLLEIGVHQGVSVQTFATYFPKGKIVGVDVILPNKDFSDYPNAELIVGDQRDAARLREICDACAPSGFDVIIDDASHIGAWSLATFEALFPYLTQGGLYVIEDWGAAYMDTWADGAKLREHQFLEQTPDFPRRIASHDFGMAGFVKSLMDKFAIEAQPFESMHVHRPFVVLKKSPPH